MYEKTIRHSGLGVVKTVRARDPWLLDEMVDNQITRWDEQWQKKIAQQRKAADRQSAQEHAEARKQLAEDLTVEAEEAIRKAEFLLAHTLVVDDAINWDDLKDKKKFSKRSPAKPYPASKPLEPVRYITALSLFSKLIETIAPSIKEKRLKDEEEAYLAALRKWREQVATLEELDRKAEIAWETEKNQYDEAKAAFEGKLAEQHANIDAECERWLSKDPIAVEEYCQMVLAKSQYPDWVPPECEVQFVGDTGLLLVDFKLPLPNDLPRVKEVKYVKAKDSIQETVISESAIEKLYESVCYQLGLRTVHELFEADTVAVITAIVFNGYIDSIDSATGLPFRAVILSFQASRDEFLAIDLAQVEPKACVRKLKGVAATKLRTLTPVAPIARMNREDSRIVDGREVLEGIDEGFNLATMGWEDFEHLVRQLFEKEFAINGAEVKVTQASRDGGVDAIVFDPDPIRGGKFVIQAKRYTKVVPVSAVRDLHGTVMHEGAVKGILVTTAHFGADSYDFAKDKPLSLLDGSNLLALLERHGTRAVIEVGR
jgi:restriction system protein